MTIKQLKTQAEWEQIHALSSYAFDVNHNEIQKENFFKLCSIAKNFGDVLNGTLTSSLMLIPFDVSLFGKFIKMGGIGNVASYPEHRGQGNIRHLFNKVFSEMKNDQILVSYLAPFSQPFYRKFGYERLFIEQELTVPSEVLKFVEVRDGYKVERIKEDNREARKERLALYNCTLGRKHGNNQRSLTWYECCQTRADNHHLAVVRDEQDQLVGYLDYKFDKEDVIISEMIYETTAALKMLLNFLTSHRSSFKNFIFGSLEDTSFLEYFDDTRVSKIYQTNGMMARIVSMSSFLEQLPIKKTIDGEVYLKVTEDVCAWNQGIIHWSFQDGVSKVTWVEAESQVATIPHYEASIGRWTQVLLGGMSLEKALNLGFVSCTHEDDFLGTVLLKGQPFLKDHF
ncbi:GNAT family N-acetyltransferase [Vagococcus silagei]|nr:GNAT family N-acetyltransferase [Vagococcus silagei]